MGGLVVTDFAGGLDRIRGLALQPDGKLVAVGETASTGDGSRDFAMARYNSDGSLDSSFGEEGWLLVAKGFACLVAPDKALRSITRGGESPRGFVAAGVVSLAAGGWACYCLWRRAHEG
jgi:hypothetical protein